MKIRSLLQTNAPQLWSIRVALQKPQSHIMTLTLTSKSIPVSLIITNLFPFHLQVDHLHQVLVKETSNVIEPHKNTHSTPRTARDV